MGTYKVIDLFAGAGGLHLGFEKAGFNITLCVDNDKSVGKTHKLNYPHIPFENWNIADVTGQQISLRYGKPDIIIGGPPCQGFSTVGNRATSNDTIRNQKDSRNRLIVQYSKLVRQLQPKFVVLENVLGIASYNNGYYIHTVTDNLRKCGYTVKAHIVNMADYGVPQLRKRYIIVANNLGLEPTIPEPDHNEKSWVSCSSVINDLADLQDDKSINHVALKHSAIMTERFNYVKQGTKLDTSILPDHLKINNYGSVYYRLDPDRPSITLVPGHNTFPIHPFLNRSLTVRESSRIQTFPDEIIFCGCRSDQGKQVGNAVPPLFSFKLATHIHAQLNQFYDCSTK